MTLGAPGVYTVTVHVSNLYGEDAYTFDLTVESYVRGDWWMYGREPKHQRCSPFAGPEAPAIRWSYFAVSALRASPILAAGDVAYVGSVTGILRAVNPDGSLKWSLDVGNGIYGTPALATDGTIYVGTLGARLMAVDADGQVKWTFATGDSVYSSPAVAPDGTVYVGCSDRNLYAVSPDGEELWRFSTGAAVKSSPAIAGDGTIYVGSQDGYLYAVDSGGSQQWRFYPELPEDQTASITDSPTIGDDGTIYVPIEIALPMPIETRLYAVNPDGTEKWRYVPAQGSLSAAAIGPDGTIYVNDTSLYALSPDNGSELWSFEIPGGDEHILMGTHAAPVVDANGVVYMPTYYSDYDPVTFKWTFEGLVFAINPDGSEKWRLTTNTVGAAVNSSSPAIGGDGTIYLASEDGHLYAISEGE